MANAIFVTAIMLMGAVALFVIKGNIDYLLAVPLAITSMLGAYVGASTALKFGSKWLKFLVVFVVIGIVIKLLVSY